MSSWSAVYVDVGYLLASAATRVTGSSLRSSVEVDYPALVRRLVEQVEADSGLPVLRVNWYDSGARPGGQPDHHQDQIGLLPKVKLRLGRLSYAGEQKGVDVRLGLDLALQGRARVADVVYLVSGDDDLTEAVEEAQGAGVQVRLLSVPGVHGTSHAVSKHLRRAADDELLVDAETIDLCVRSRALAPGLVPASDGSDSVADELVAADDSVVVLNPVDTDPTGDTSTTDEPSMDESAVPEPDGAATEAGEAVPPSRPAGIPGPSPAVLGRKRASEVVLPEPLTPTTGAVTDAGPGLWDAVAYAVVSSWCRTATPGSLAELRGARPTVPGELDRALLLDLSSRSGAYDIDDAARHGVRERFWHHVDRIRLT
ncbi:NYN domain-containing protein [Knoellia sp. LjRoot47]|uniref:NYN domain-containing protein n=1 Tax=Knoellia sp. LjRoot47 TaxID=3342330 RepID=UPI003ECC5584